MTTETIYRGSNGLYYTAAGLQDFLAYGTVPSGFSSSPMAAEKYNVRVKVGDQSSGTVYYDYGPVVTRTVNGVRVTYNPRDYAATDITYPVYKLNGSFIAVRGACEACPIYQWIGAVGRETCFVSADEARYKFSGGNTHELGVIDSRVSNLVSGSAYDVDNIVYNTASNCIWFGGNVALDRAFVVFGTYFHFVAISSANATPATSPNTQTRTVSDGKKRALVSDIESYNNGTATATVKTSTGTLTFGYRRVLRQNLAEYEPHGGSRTVGAMETTDTTTGTPIVLRRVNTKSDLSGTWYDVDDDVSNILTRHPSLETYDTRYTLYAEWVYRYMVSLDHQGGVSQAATIYYGRELGGFFSDAALDAPASSVAVPHKTDALFLGYFTAADGGELVIDEDGNIDANFKPTSGVTVYAHWKTVTDVVLNSGTGTGGTDYISYDSELGGFTADGGKDAVSSVPIPSIPQFRFLGYFTAPTGGTKCIDADGTITQYLVDLSTAAPSEIFAQYERVSYRLSIVGTNGEPDGSIFCNGTEATFYSDGFLENEIDSVVISDRPGYSFRGYYVGSELVIDHEGLIVCEAFSQDIIAVPSYEANVYTLSFAYAGGSGSVESKEVTFGEPIGTLPAVSHPGWTFDGWLLNGTKIDAASVYNVPGDATATAEWRTGWGDLTDYWGLEIPDGPLLLISSTSGAARSAIETVHTGTLDTVNVSGIILNPTCTYRIRKPGTVHIMLGKAYGSAVITGLGTAANPYRAMKSGYMLVQAEYRTATDGEPILIVRGAANEGYVWSSGRMVSRLTDAINRWTVNFAVSPDHIAQDPMSAVNGGGEMLECRTLITCDPIVPIEGGMPCASDVVNGKIVVTATTAAYHGENEPTASGLFVETNGVPGNESDVDFTSYAITAERSL